jgi:DNA-binding transcriptional regulator GbsR (MarR family)
MSEEIRKAFPNGIPKEVFDSVNHKLTERHSAEERIGDIKEHISELQERIDEIQAWLDGKLENRPQLYFDSDWDQYPNG